jgi:hypothetical protein
MEKVKSGNLIVSLATPEFRRHFEQRVLPHLCELEEDYEELHNKSVPVATIVACCIVAALVALVVAKVIISGSWEPRVLLFVVAGFTTCVVLVCVGRASHKAEFKKLFKESPVKNELISFFGDFQAIPQSSKDYIERKCAETIEKLCIFPFNIISADDMFHGTYNGLDVEIIEMHTQIPHPNSRKGPAAIGFSGLMLTISSNKTFKSHTIISIKSKEHDLSVHLPFPDIDTYMKTMPKDGTLRSMARIGDTLIVNGEHYPRIFDTKTLKTLEPVLLEDVEFTETFQVLSDDQVESRYLITPSFMQRMMKSSRKNSLRIVFKDNKVYIFITNLKDLFEIPFKEGSFKDIRYYQNILAEFAQVLNVVDILKLEQDIGL